MSPLRGAVWLVLACVVAVGPASASAGTYDVLSCGNGTTAVNHSWIGSTNEASYLDLSSSCPASGPYSGLAAYDGLGAPGNSPSAATAAWVFTAPAGTTIRSLRYSRYLGKD